MTATLYLLRHGRTGWNRAGRIQGRTDEPLDDETRLHLASLRLPEAAKAARLVSSPLVRAVETATILGGREPEMEPALIEMDWGGWEGLRGVDLIADPASGYRHIEHWTWDFSPPAGETPRQVWQRLEPWLATLKGPVLAVTHIGVMRVLLARATSWAFEGEPPFKVKRDRIYRIDIDATGRLRFDNEPVRLLKADA